MSFQFAMTLFGFLIVLMAFAVFVYSGGGATNALLALVVLMQLIQLGQNVK